MSRKVQKNILTDDESIKMIKSENKLLLRDFLSYLKSIDRAPSTIHIYQKNIEAFFVYNLIHNQNKDFTEITKRDFIRFQDHALHTLNWSSNRLHTVKSSLSTMSNYIENILDDEYPGYKNVIQKIDSPTKRKVLTKSVFTEEELNGLLEHLVKNDKIRQATALALAMYSGRRKSELFRFRISDFKDENIIYDSLWKSSEPIKTKGRGANGKPIHLYVLKDQFKPYLDLLLEDYKKHNIRGDCMFVSYKFHNKPLSIESLNEWARYFTKILGKDFYWHSIRHYFTTMLIKQNVPIDIIQDMVNWDSASMLQIYSDLTRDANIGKFFAEHKIA